MYIIILAYEHIQDSYPAHVSLRFGSSDDEHKPLLRMNDPEPSICSTDVIAGRTRHQKRRKRHVHFSETDNEPLPPVRGSLLPSKDYDVCYFVSSCVNVDVQQWTCILYTERVGIKELGTVLYNSTP